MQQPNGTSIPNFQQTINSITYPQQQQIYFETTNPTSNNSDFYSIQQQIYQTQQIGELNETKQQQNSSEQFTANNGNIINKPKKGLGPGRPPKIKIDNNKREENAGCSNMYEYNNSGILKPDQMQMLSIEAKSANNIMSGGSTNQPNLSTVQFPYGDLSNACFGGPTPFDLSSIPPDYNNLGVAWAGHPSSYSINSAPTPAICGGFGDIDNIYANGLMALPGQLQYELDPMLATGYGVWPTANGYYLGNDPVKLLTSDGSLQISQPPPQQYLGTASTSNNYTGENIQSTATTFYGAPQPLQNIPPPSIDPNSVFHTGISTLPPPPSQLASTDQLYGLQNAPNGVFGNSTSFDSLPPSNLLSVSNTNTETSNTPATLLNLECSSSNINQFNIRQPEQLLFVGTPNGQIQKIEENINTNSVLTSTTIPSTLSLNSAPPIVGTISSKTMGKRLKAKKNIQNSNILLSRPSTSAGGFLNSLHSKLGSESPSIREKLKQRDTSSSNGRKSRSRSLLKDSDDDKSAEEREVERRNANNTRERIRVRDINAAFKELARLCCNHMPNLEERNLTKLNTLIKAVELIPMLEKMVDEKTRMMDPRGDSVKRRMETMPSSSLLLNPTVSSNGILFNNCGSSSDLSSLASSSLNQQHFE